MVRTTATSAPWICRAVPCGAVDLLQDADANGGAAVSVPAVLALDDPDATRGIDGSHIAGVVAGTAELFGLAAVPSHQVTYGELERTVIQSVQLRDAQPQSTGPHTFPGGPLPCLLNPEATGHRSDHGREDEDPPVRQQPLHDGDHHNSGRHQDNLPILLLGMAYRPAPGGTSHRATAAHRTATTTLDTGP